MAFTKHSIVAVRTKDGLRCERRALPDGLIVPSATTPNIQSVADLAQITGELLESVGIRRERMALALPDLAITIALYPASGDASERELRRELVTSLPYPPTEARCDFWRGHRGERLGAAVRNAVVRQYEQLAEAAECRLSWVDGTSLARIPGWSARGARNGELVVHLQLYLGHYFMSVFRGGELIDARMKLRTQGDVSHVGREVLRMPVLHVSESVDAVELFGSDAGALGAALEAASEVRDIRVADDDERLQLQSAIQALLARGRP